MFDNHVNLLFGTVKIPPLPSSTGETLPLMPGDVARFEPDMPVTLFPPDVTVVHHDNSEIAYVHEVNKATGVLTLTRGTEETHKLQVRFGWRVIGGITTKTSTDIEAALDLKYELPVSGIPRSALDASTQSSLTKADTALQVAPVTSVACKTGAVTVTKADVGDGVC